MIVKTRLPRKRKGQTLTIEPLTNLGYYSLQALGMEVQKVYDRAKVCGYFTIEQLQGGYQIVGNGVADGFVLEVAEPNYGNVAHHLPAMVNNKLSIIIVTGVLLPPV